MNKNPIYQTLRRIGIVALAGYGALTAFRDVKDLIRKPYGCKLILNNSRESAQRFVMRDGNDELLLYVDGESMYAETSPGLEKMLGKIEVVKRSPLEELGAILASQHQ